MCYTQPDEKCKKPVISDEFDPLKDERCNYKAMIENLTIWKLFNKTALINLK